MSGGTQSYWRPGHDALASPRLVALDPSDAAAASRLLDTIAADAIAELETWDERACPGRALHPDQYRRDQRAYSLGAQRDRLEAYVRSQPDWTIVEV